MFCTKCGKQLNDNERFCTQCGARMGENADAASDTIGQTDVAVYGGFAKKSKSKIYKILIPIILILALAVTTFAHPVSRNAIMKTVMSEEAYFEYVMKNQAQDLADTLVGFVSTYREMLEGDVESSGSLGLELGEKSKDLIAGFGGYEVSSVVDWFDSATITFDGRKKDDITGSNVSLLVNGTNIANLEVVMDKEDMYLSVPEFSDTAIRYSLSELYDEGDMPNFNAYMDELMSVVPKDKVFKDIIVRYITCMAGSFEKVEEEKIKIDAGGIKQSAVSMTVTIDEESMIDMLSAVLDEVKDDKDIEKIIKNLSELDLPEVPAIDGDEVYDEFISAVEELQDEMDEDIYLGVEEFELSFIVNNRGELIGFKAEIEGGIIEYYLTKDGNKYGQNFSIIPPSQGSVELEGSGVVKRGKYNGEMTLSAMGMDVLSAKLEGVDKGLMEDGVFSGKCTLSAADNIGRLLSMSGNSEISSIVSGLSIEFNSTSTKSETNLLTSVYMDDGLLGTLSFSSKDSSKAKVKIPEDSVDAMDQYEMSDWASDATSGLHNLIDRLKDAGLPSKIADEMYNSLI